ncbi:MAG: O-antigen ligase family protein, partial [Patescibacteria group bacterium]|nr:O-antigen ligase family protein [Patescibacteria group bacterium]
MKTLNAIIQYGIPLFVFLIPWQARLILDPGAINGTYWEYGTTSLYATEILLLLVLLAVVSKGMMHIIRRKPRFVLKQLNSPGGGLFLLAVWAGVSLFWGVDRGVGLEHWLVLVSAGAVFLVIASGAVPFRQLSWAIILSGSIQAILAFVQFRWQWLPASTLLGTAFQHASMLGASVVETDMGRWLRGYGSFPHPNILGGWLALGLLLAIKEAGRRGRSSAARALAYIPIALLSIGLAITFSRGAWLAFDIGLVLLVIKQRRESVLSLAVIILFIGTLVFSYPEPFSERIFGSGRLEEKSIQERSGGASEAWHIIKQHPLVGIGIGNYGLAVHRDIDDTKPAYYYQPVHNVPLLILAELGAIGLILVVVFLLSLRALVLKGEAILSSRNSLMSGAVFLLPLAILSFFDHYLWSLYSGM